MIDEACPSGNLSSLVRLLIQRLFVELNSVMSFAPDSPDDDRLAAVLDEHLAALEAGTAASETELLARHPELADQLRECLASLQFLRQAGPSVGEVAVPQPLFGALNLFPRENISPSEEPSAHDPNRPGVLGDYRLGHEVGRGGMGVVYEAEQISLNRRVALKVLPFAAVLDSKQLRRFKNEAQLAAQLHHTNIVPVYAVGCERGVHYYAMQFIEGQTVAAVIKDLRSMRGLEPGGDDGASSAMKKVEARQFAHAAACLDRTEVANSVPDESAHKPNRRNKPAGGDGLSSSTVIAGMTTDGAAPSKAYFRLVAEIGVQVAEVLDHAHEMGVVHRDVKPSNLLLDLKGKVWVTDFGLAQVQTDLGLTMTGDLVGTIRYMSPEQAMAKRVPLDHRTDIYSLGVTLYELFTLEPAFPGTDRHDVLRRIAFDDPVAPRRINKDLPAELETIVLKTLMKNPSGRYATARELADDLQRFLQDRPILAKRPTLWERTAKLARRHQTAVRVAGVLLAVLLVGSWISLLALARQKKATDDALRGARNEKQLADSRSVQADLQRERAEKALARAETAEREQARELWRSYLAAAKSGRRSRNVGQRFDSLSAIASAAALMPQVSPSDAERLALRDEAIACLQLFDLQLEQRGSRAVEGFGIDSQLELIAEAEESGDLVVSRLSNGREVVRIPNAGRTGWGFQFTADGRFIVGHVGNDEVRVWSLVSRDETLRTRFDPRVHGFVLSSDSRLLAVATPAGTTEVFEVATGQRLKTLATGFGVGLFAAFSPDSRRLAVIGEDSAVRVWDVGTGEPPQVIETNSRPMSVAWRSTGQALAIGTMEGQILIHDVESRRAVRTLTGHQGAVVQLSYHPWSEVLISNAWLTETPVTVPRLAGGQWKGTLDLLLQLTDGNLVIIDHKSAPLRREHCAAKAASYSGQLSAYQEMIRSTGQSIHSTWIHFPLAGVVAKFVQPGDATKSPRYSVTRKHCSRNP
jgi:serine/threonine protein kinase